MKITYYVHDLRFPLREGYRKEAWFLAKEAKLNGYEVEILSSFKKRKVIIKDGIKIRYGKWLICKSNIIHYISQPTPFIIPSLLFSKAKKQVMSVFEGYLNGFWKRPWDFFLSWLVNKKIDIITLQTDFQIRLFKKTKLNVEIKKIPPMIPVLSCNIKKSKTPSLLFMSHMDPLKGINEVINAFLIVRKKIEGLKLIVADSGLTKKTRIFERIKKVNKEDIILKTIVDPQEELSKAWIYLYPVQSAKETFSVPLSLIESIQVGTPYISTKVGGIPEYFDERSLVKPKNPLVLAEKIIEFIENPKVYPMKKKIENKEVWRMFREIYG